MALAALGVVYGDLGTSPLYAVRECFRPQPTGVAPTPENVLGVMSLIFWALTLVVIAKYLTVVMRADNHGEGGILAILALLRGRRPAGDPEQRFSRGIVFATLAVFGTSLLLADGMITPAISVLSAVEGLELAAPTLEHLVIPITVVILVVLFRVQRYGTDRIASIFGPTMLVWFLMIAAMGLPWVVRYPQVLSALSPHHGVELFVVYPSKGFFLLGAVVLCVTGTEALYADMGHFGRGPIRLAWYLVVFPALLLNYFGQGAFILSRNGQIVETNVHGDPKTILLFFEMVSPLLLYPVLVVSTAATIIASQALISGAFSLAEQAVQLGYLPRLKIVHTSGEMTGQIYVPLVNWALLFACVLLVVVFKTSSHLAAAYGVAVIGTMLITSLLLAEVTHVCWGWPRLATAALLALLLMVDVPFFIANLAKVVRGGWIPLLVGAILFTLMTTWYRGQRLLQDPNNTRSYPIALKQLIGLIEEMGLRRDEATCVVLTAAEDRVPVSVFASIKRTRVLPKRMVLFTVRGEPVPTVEEEDVVEVRDYGQDFFGVTARHGFMEVPRMPRFLELCTRKGLDLDPQHVMFFISRMTVVPTGNTPLATWRKQLFAFLYLNARPATSYYHLPPDRVAELGRHIEL
ncbi:MAG: KUP/HAK/KT family potassium transporter [Gemmataceae bacterium]|nr:KUP/HAK/KT family potassium transporter [Gemmataceae bacterium]